MVAGVEATVLALQGIVGLDETPEGEGGGTVVAFHGKLNVFVGADCSGKGAIALQRGANGEVAAKGILGLLD